MTTRISSALAGCGLTILSAAASAAITPAQNPIAAFDAQINGTTINSGLTASNIGVSINGSPTVFWSQQNSRVLQQLATDAGASIVFKNGVQIPVVTLGKDVNVTVFTRADNSAASTAAATQIADFSFQQGLVFNPDPAISLPFSVLNRTSTNQTYSFSFTMNIAPVLTQFNSPFTQVKSSLTGTLRSDGTGSTDIAPTGSNTGIVMTSVSNNGASQSLDQNGSVGVGNSQSFLAGLCTGTTACGYAGQYNPGPLASNYKSGPVPTGTGITTMTQLTSFSLTPGDRATMVAFSEIVPVPEPEGYALMLAGMAALAAWGRRRAARAA